MLMKEDKNKEKQEVIDMACCWFLNEGVENNWLSDLTLLYYHNIRFFEAI